jgi:N utilization substance protein B
MEPEPTESRSRLSREIALLLLFQLEAGRVSPEETVQNFQNSFDPASDTENGLEMNPESFEDSWPGALELFFGTSGHLAELDAAIEKASLNWSLARLAQVDRALLRLALFEMRFRDDIPPKVSLNEALEIAKSYGGSDSAAFINGILDRLLTEAAGKPAGG